MAGNDRSLMAPAPRIRFGRFEVLPRADGKTIVYDYTLQVGRRTVAVLGTRDDARAECQRLSQQATSLGEPNDPAPKEGFRLDWTDPKSWDDVLQKRPWTLPKESKNQ
jgi:hypothetical protein